MMRVKFIFVIMTAFCLHSAYSYKTIKEEYFYDGTLYYVDFDNSPFPNKNRRKGYHYKGKFYNFEEHYNCSTAVIFLPNHIYTKNHLLNFIFFFHGWYTNLNRCIRDYNLIQQFPTDMHNSLLIIPETASNAPDGFCGNFTNLGGFKKYIIEIQNFLKDKINIDYKPNIVLTAHSGGYKCISSILQFGAITIKISDIYLFDALYSDENIFANYINSHQTKFINICTKTGGTWNTSLKMLKLIKNKSPLVKYSNNILFDELINNDIVFYFTSLQHDNIPKIFFSLCLQIKKYNTGLKQRR